MDRLPRFSPKTFRDFEVAHFKGKATLGNVIGGLGVALTAPAVATRLFFDKINFSPESQASVDVVGWGGVLLGLIGVSGSIYNARRANEAAKQKLEYRK